MYVQCTSDNQCYNYKPLHPLLAYYKLLEAELTISAVVVGIFKAFQTLNGAIPPVASVVSIHIVILGNTKYTAVSSIVILLTHYSKPCS